MIFNISRDTFGTIRMGDLVAVCNVIEYLRLNNPNIKFHIKPDALDSSKHCQDFHSYLIGTTNYFSAFEGSEYLPWKKVNLWDFRALTEDRVSIPNTETQQKKIVIFPLFDAQYNTYRNWPIQRYMRYIEYYFNNYPEYERVICIRDKNLLPLIPDENVAKISTDFLTNLWHIKTAQIFVGGDTGTTHFAFSLDKPPMEMIYCMSGRGLLHTAPFYLLKGKGQIDQYWLDFEGTTWQ